MYSQTWANDHLRIATTCLSITTTILWLHLELLLLKWPLNNEHLSKTATILGSRGWSLFTGLTVFSDQSTSFERNFWLKYIFPWQRIIQKVSHQSIWSLFSDCNTAPINNQFSDTSLKDNKKLPKNLRSILKWVTRVTNQFEYSLHDYNNSPFELLYHKWPLNNDHLSTTVIILKF